MSTTMDIQNLQAKIGDKEILKGLKLKTRTWKSTCYHGTKRCR